MAITVDSGERNAAKSKIAAEFAFKRIVGTAPELEAAKKRIVMVAPSMATVLFSGETGVGKELFARALHYLSERFGRAFVAVDCGALPTTLFENELFGHKKGAFTDARIDTTGLVGAAEGGTLFLDEIEALSLEAQSKLLRLLQDRSYRPLGQTQSRKADIRVIAATNLDLRKQVGQGLFRRDLFYRFAITVDIPPLRRRKGDIPALSRHFISRYCRDYGVQTKCLSAKAQEKLVSYDWQGNVRELRNVMLESVLTTHSVSIPPESINIPTFIERTTTDSAVVTAESILAFSEARKQTMACFEKNYVTRLLMATAGNISKAARLAEYDRKNLSRLIRRHGIDVHAYRGSAVPLESQRGNEALIGKLHGMSRPVFFPPQCSP